MTEGIEEEASEEVEWETAPGDRDPCEYEIDGDPHCALARLSVGGEADHPHNAMGQLVLRPDDSVSLGMIGPDDPLTVDERQADSVADFIESHSPDLVEVIATGVEVEAFQAACLPPAYPEDDTTAGVIAEPYPIKTLGMLTGEGEVIFEAQETSPSTSVDSASEPEASECYTLRAE